MNSTNHMATKWFWALLAATAGLLFYRLGAAPIYILDEAKNAQCAREMFYHGRWIVPTFNGALRTDKPVLHYWFMILAYKMFGVNAFAARFFSVMMGLGTICITYFFVKKWVNQSVAFFTALVLALATQFLFEFRLSVPDPYLIFFTTAGLLAGYSYLQTKQLKWILIAAAMLALATLAKGPVALALPGLCFLLFLASSKRFKQIVDINLLVGLLVFLAIALPWYYAVHVATNGLFTQGFFYDHNVSRFSAAKEGHGGSFFIIVAIVFLGMLPLCAFIVSAIKKSSNWKQQPIVFFSKWVMVIYIVFFGLSKTKLPNYPMPCYPFVAIILGSWLQQMRQQEKKLPNYGLLILLLIGLAIPIGGWFALHHQAATKALANWAFVLLFLPLCIAIILFKKNKWGFNKTLQALSLAYFVFNALFITVLYPKVYNQNPVTHINAGLQPNATLVAFKDFNPAFVFNNPVADGTINVFTDADSLKNTLSYYPNNTYIITVKDRLAAIDSSYFTVVASQPDLFENPTTVLLKRR